MLEQLLELSRKATESSVEMQNIMLKLLMQDWLSNSQTKEGISASWGGSARKRWIELTIAALNKHREAADAAYRTGIQLMEQALHVSEAKSPEDLARATRRLFEDARRIGDLNSASSELGLNGRSRRSARQRRISLRVPHDSRRK